MDEKEQIEHIDHVEHAKDSNGSESLETGVPSPDLAYEKKIIHKVDWRLLPILGAIYSIALIDRGNMAIAAVAGMSADLELGVGNRYSVSLLIFFIPYALFEFPSNLALRRVGAARWLPSIALLWGIVMIGMGFSKNYPTLVVLRTILGFFEAGFFPGAVYLISCWYVRYETQKRMSGFYLLSLLGSGFANILGYGLSHITSGGIAGWRWIFIVEGIITCFLGITAFFVIIDFPDKVLSKGNSSFLSAADVQIVKARIDRDRDDSVADDITWKKALKIISDWRIWCYALMFMCSTMPSYAFAYFLPQILKGMGYSTGMAQILSAPPYIFTCAIAYGLAVVADRVRMRGPFIAAQSIICIVGLSLTAYSTNNAVRYFGTFLGLSGGQGNIPAVLSYQANNIRMNSKRSVGSALQIAFGAIGGILASTTYRAQDAPKYINGLWATIGCQLLVLLLLCFTTTYFWKRNHEQARGTLKEPNEGHPDFRYTY